MKYTVELLLQPRIEGLTQRNEFVGSIGRYRKRPENNELDDYYQMSDAHDGGR